MQVEALELTPRTRSPIRKSRSQSRERGPSGDAVWRRKGPRAPATRLRFFCGIGHRHHSCALPFHPAAGEGAGVDRRAAHGVPRGGAHAPRARARARHRRDRRCAHRARDRRDGRRGGAHARRPPEWDRPPGRGRARARRRDRRQRAGRPAAPRPGHGRGPGRAHDGRTDAADGDARRRAPRPGRVALAARRQGGSRRRRARALLLAQPDPVRSRRPPGAGRTLRLAPRRHVRVPAGRAPPPRRAPALAARAAGAAGAAAGARERDCDRGGRMDGGRALDRGRHGGRPRAGAGGAGRGADMSGKNGKTKFIFVTGGVVSSLGKGVASASIGALLEARGLKVTLVKMDPYINVDPGTMSPFQHGEVFVTDDGAETDLDLGHYERYVSPRMGKRNNSTTGQVHDPALAKERRGDYLGGTVQVIPHITDEIKRRIKEAAEGANVCIGEVGGTVGDIESLPFIEAIRQFGWDLGRQNTLYVHLTLVPFIPTAGELKTKPTQHSVKELTGLGIQPDVLLCRAAKPLEKKVKAKIALFCNVEEASVISAPDVETIYEVPLVFHAEGLDERVVEKLNIFTGSPNLTRWRRIVSAIKNPKETVEIAMVGKYVDLTDSYKSLNEALTHGGIANECRVKVTYVDSEKIEQDGLPDSVRNADAILVPMGFGPRGTEGKIAAVRHAREGKVPFLGICFGMQMAVIEYARHVCGLERANSTEVDPETPHPVIDLMTMQRKLVQKGGTMRLGAYPCVLAEGTLARKIGRASCRESV